MQIRDKYSWSNDLSIVLCFTQMLRSIRTNWIYRCSCWLKKYIFTFFVTTYCYVIFELKTTFTFIWKCINDMFFYKKCLESKIMIDDFALKFFSSFYKRRKINIIEKNMQIKNEIMHTRFDDVNIDVIFQFCVWYAMKIIQIRITRKKYSRKKNTRRQLKLN